MEGFHYAWFGWKKRKENEQQQLLLLASVPNKLGRGKKMKRGDMLLDVISSTSSLQEMCRFVKSSNGIRNICILIRSKCFSFVNV